jgi:glycosyltransferase involved in cell wall biosynthesis
MDHGMLSFCDLRPLVTNLPPVTLLSFSSKGGAGASVFRLFECLTSSGVDARLITLQKPDGRYTDRRVIQITDKGKSLFTKSRVNLGITLSRRYPDRPHGYEYFSTVQGVVDLSTLDIAKDATLIHLHLTEGIVGWPDSRAVLAGKPLVWTLHDMNPFTGGCYYTAGCERFSAAGCKNCPQLGPSFLENDLASENFAAKSVGYADLKLTLVAPGRWISACARASRLMGRFPQENIPYSVDTDIFLPMPQKKARVALGLPIDRRIVLFSANDANRRNKGYHVLSAALARLLPKWDNDPPLLLILGTPPRETPPGYGCCLPGFLADKKKLAAAYAAADVFVTPSFQEVFGQVTAEAQACGTPGIGFYDTGAEDIIQDGVTGYLVEHPGLPLANGAVTPRSGAYRSFLTASVEDLAKQIKKILDMPHEEYKAMRHACRAHALAEYWPVLQTERYLRLYRRILSLPESSL